MSSLVFGVNFTKSTPGAFNLCTWWQWEYSSPTIKIHSLDGFGMYSYPLVNIMYLVFEKDIHLEMFHFSIAKFVH